MPKLTRRGLGITEGFISGCKRDELIQKLGHIEHQGEQLARDICDHACRYPTEADPDELTTICEACPVTRLMEMIS